MPEKLSANDNPTLSAKSYKLLAVVGPTASGKSELAVSLAKLYNGEIISCDSRQVYKGMDVGTGKVKGKWIKGHYIYKGIIHHCIDYADPKRQFSVSLFQKDAQKALEDIRKRSKLPILCGGTGQWIDAVVHNIKLPEVKPDPKLRKHLEKQRTSSVVSEPFVTVPVSFSHEDKPTMVAPKRITCKPIVMDLNVSDDYPF